MSTADIIAELDHLAPDERAKIFEHLCDLQERDAVKSGGPTAEEKRLLDEAWREFERDGNTGTPWREVIKRIRAETR